MKKIFIFLCIASLLSACEKGWLEEKRDIALAVPTTLKDFRALLNNNMFQSDFIGMAETSADDYYFPSTIFLSRGEQERNFYLWSQPFYPSSRPVSEWDDAYTQILYCNVVLDGLANFTPKPSETILYSQLYGEALFYRARTFSNLAMLFAPPFNAEDAAKQLGIPLRLSSDVNDETARAPLNEVYDRIFKDLQEAAQLLPTHVAEQTYPKKAAAYALLARVYLACGYYDDALRYVDSTLALHSALLEFNQLPNEAAYPIQPFNEEVIYQSASLPLSSNNLNGYGAIDTMLIRLYDTNDLRLALYFEKNEAGTYYFRGSHTGYFQLFTGITTGEILLIQAECLARAGNHKQALASLDRLLIHRYDGEYTPLQLEPARVLPTILQERRKELLRRGIRWSDLRRLNKEEEHQTTLRRVLDGEVFELLPNDPRYTFPIPDYIIQTTGITQNNR